MMLIATGLAAAMFAAASFVPDSAEAPTSAAPPVMVNVYAARGVPAALVTRVLAETSAIWRAGGVEFVWRRIARDVLPLAGLAEAGPYQSSTLRVVIGDERGSSRDNKVPLGWIVFDGEQPQPEIYLSSLNARSLMEAARAAAGLLALTPPVQRELLLGRALGRALAHEMGHYLLASKVHTERGLLKASRTAAELFATTANGFHLDHAQRRELAARMRGDTFVVRR